MSNLDIIKNQLKLIKPELSSKYFVSTIGLFGSVLRKDFNEKSDIDIIVDFKQPVGIEFIDLANFLEETFHRKIDIVTRNGIKKMFFAEIKNDIIYV